MKKRRWLAFVLTGAVLLCGIFGNTSAITVSAAKTVKEDSWPEGPDGSKLSSASAIVMELSTGLILYKKNIHAKRYPASITKVLTAMLVAENASMNETVTFSEEAVYGIESGSSTIYTDVGEKLTIEQCLYAIMLESANEVCLGAGEHVAGSIDNFVDMMNQRVAELGLKNTHFNNPNGLPDPKHYTTAYDMAVIARQAMQNATFRKVVSTKSYQMPKTNTHKMVRFWNNHHQMVNGYKYPQYEYKYCIGGKTGYTHAARNTLVTYAEKDGMELVCVVMKADGPTQGEPNEYTDTTSLLNFGFEKYKKYVVGETTNTMNEALFNTYDSYFNTEASPLHLSGESTVVLPKGVEFSEAKQEVTYDTDVTLKQGDNVIGEVTYTYAGKTVGSTDIIYTMTKENNDTKLDSATRGMVKEEIQQIEEQAEQNAKKANVWRKIKGVVKAFFGNRVVQVLLILLGAAVLCFGIVCLVKNIELPKIRRRGRKRISGGYRSKGGRRKYAQMKRERRSMEKGKKRRRRNMRRRYQSTTPTSENKTKRSKGLRYHKKHKNTKESFGKNFFDF